MFNNMNRKGTRKLTTSCRRPRRPFRTWKRGQTTARDEEDNDAENATATAASRQ